MKLKVLGTYTSNTVGSFLSTPSGQFLKPDGTVYTDDDLSLLRDMYNEVKTSDNPNGIMASYTDEKYVKKSLGNTDTTGSNKAPEYVDQFDHIVIEDIPANINDSDLIEAVKKQINDDYFYIENQGGGKAPKKFYITGEHEILERIDVTSTGNKHLHLLVNRRGIVDKQQLQTDLQKWQNSNDPNKDTIIDSISNVIGKMTIKGQDKALAQSLSLDNKEIQNQIIPKINKALADFGIAPLLWGGNNNSKPNQENNNRKTTPEAKIAVNEIIDSGFTEESVNKIVDEIQTQEFSTTDSIIIQKRLDENKTKAEQLATELQKLVSESRQLEQAQKAVNENFTLSNEVKKLKSLVEEVNKKVVEKDEYIDTLKSIQKDEIEELSKDYQVKVSQKDEEIKEKTEKLTELEEEFETVWNDKKAIENQFKEYTEKTEKELEQIPQLQQLLDTANNQNKQYQEMFAMQQEQIKQNQELLKQSQEQFKQALDENIRLEKQRLEIEQIKEKAVEDLRKLAKELEQKEQENKEFAKVNQELKSSNAVLSNTLTQFADLSNRLKTNYSKFIETMKEKLKSNQALKKDIAAINREFAELDKKNQVIEKEVKTVVDTVKTENSLTDTQKNLMNMFSTQEKKKPEHDNVQNRNNPTGRKPT